MYAYSFLSFHLKGTNLPELGLLILCNWMMAPPPKSRKRKSADNIGDKAASTSSNVVKSPYFSTTKADSSTTETGETLDEIVLVT